ncbi:hypothetical protein AM387_01180 [Klebsiella pneumoniae]|nr:hypothetical protein AM388_07195 [Klebsiella pneumoniae]AWD95146.1 hypothetical protein AM389_07465 [Klebsiella pneumoniae]AWS82322.1 hypothetical protein AM387_01180 [Klebsiella pneumoniae]
MPRRSAAVGKGTLRGSRVANRAVQGENTRRQRGSDSDVDIPGNDSNLLIVFYVQIMPDDFVMQLHRF